MSEPSPESLVDRVDRLLAKGEAAVVVIVLFVMIGLSSLNLLLHKAFGAGLEWADIVVRQMVLWIGFMGGALATSEGRHIAIDLVGKLMPPKPAAAVRVVTSAAAGVLAGFMLKASIQFVKDEHEMGTTLVGELPSWPFKLVIPLALGLIVFHFFVATYRAALVAAGRRAPPRGESAIGDEELSP